MNQCYRAGEEVVQPPHARPSGRTGNTLQMAICALGGLCTPFQRLSRAILPLLLSFPVTNPTSHLKGTHTLIQIILIIRELCNLSVHCSAGSDPPAMDAGPVTASRSTPPSSSTPDLSSSEEEGDAQGTAVCPGLPAVLRAVPSRAHTSEPKEQHLSHLGLMPPSMQQRVENMKLKALESIAGVCQ